MAEFTRIFAFDLETYLIGPCVTAPPIVCLSWAACPVGTNPADLANAANAIRDGQFQGGSAVLPRILGGVGWGLLPADKGLDLLAHQLAQPDALIVGHNAPFDLWCAAMERPGLHELIVAALAAGRIRDTQVRDQLIDIAAGEFRSRSEEDPETGEIKFRAIGYGLTDLCERRLGFRLEKGEDGWRLRYSELVTVPIARWPVAAVTYAVLDAVSTLACYLSQAAQWDPIPDEGRQTRAAWALAAVAGRGLCVDPPAVETLTASLAADVVAARASLQSSGIYRADGSKDMGVLRAQVQAAYQARGKLAQGTPTGEISTSRQTLLDSGDPTLRALADVGAREKLLTSFVPVLQSGFQAPIVCRYHTLVETGRTSCVGPNIQQLPRYPGVRDCFVPRPGFLFCSVDYDTLELRTLAQVCLDLLGWSDMAALLQGDPGYDLHSEFAAAFLGITYSDFRARLKSPDSAVRAAAKLARQQAKAANFGYPGGLGPEKFQLYAKTTYQLDLPLDECQRLRAQWKAKWPEVVEFQNLVSRSLDPETSRAAFALVHTGFLRGDCRYTQGCNTQFQGLAAAGAKEALWRVVRDGPAHDVFPVAFLHDEILAEVPIDTADSAARWLAESMVGAMATVVPDVPITASPALMERWYKGAEPVYSEAGKLIPWRPTTAAGE